jgi:Rrf2 family protein
MRITLEADYAVRIVYYLATTNAKSDAGAIADQVGVTMRFTLKILGKLSRAGIVRSFKGAAGGYVLSKSPEEISLLDIITIVDGPIAINKCLWPAAGCSRVADKEKCPFHIEFQRVSDIISKELESVKMSKFLP